MEYKGQLKGFPEHVVNAMLDEQERQGNKRDISVFETESATYKYDGGFTWEKSVFGHVYWYNVINNRQFHLIPAPSKLKTFHVTFYPNPAEPISSGVNIEAENMGKAYQIFKEKHGFEPIYIIQK